MDQSDPSRVFSNVRTSGTDLSSNGLMMDAAATTATTTQRHQRLGYVDMNGNVLLCRNLNEKNIE